MKKVLTAAVVLVLLPALATVIGNVLTPSSDRIAGIVGLMEESRLLPTWGLLTWLVGTLVLGYLAACHLVSQSREVVVPKAPSAPIRPPFVPNDLQEKAIRVMRFGDTLWLSAEQIAGAIRDGGGEHPVSDIEQALGQLVGAGWARDLIRPGGREFKLADPGLDYARGHNFPVMPFESRQRIERQRRGV